jgi:hypothetical protein
MLASRSMSGPSLERREHYRGKARPGRVLTIQYAIHGQSSSSETASATWQTCETRDIGIGGAFIMANDLAVGQSIWIQLRLPSSEQQFVLPAHVKWISSEPAGGAGVQFVDVDVDVLLELNDYFEAM